MLREKTNNSRSEVQNASTFSSIIAKVTKMGVKIRDINQHFAEQYKIQPLLVLIPFTAGVMVMATVAFMGSDNYTENSLAVSTAGFTGTTISTGSGNNLPNSEPTLLSQVDDEDPDIEKLMEDDTETKSIPKLEISEEMKNELSPEEIAVFELFSELAEIQSEKGMESPEAAALSGKLDVLIEKIKVQQENQRNTEEQEDENNSDENIDDENISDKVTPAPIEKTSSRFRTKPISRPTINKPTTIPPVNQVPEKLATPVSVPAKAVTENQGPPKSSITPVKEVKPVTPTVTKPIAQTINKTTPAVKTPVDNKAISEPVATAVDKDQAEEESQVLEEGKIRIKTNDGVIDLNELLIAIGKELELNYYFEDGAIPSGKIMLQQYGVIDRSELLPLLESVMAKSDYMMVKEGPYTKIVKRVEIHKNTSIFSPDLDENYDALQDSVVATIVTLEHVDFEQVKSILEKFIPYTDIITPIENTNKLVITDYARNMTRILEIIKMVDVAGPAKELLIITPKFLKPDNTKTIIEDMYTKLYGESGISGGNATASETPPPPVENIAQMNPAQRAEYLKSRRDAATQNKNVGKKTADAQTVPAPDITVDKRTGRMFIIGTKQELANVNSILALFDVPKSGPQAKWEIKTPVYVDSKNVVGQIETLMKAMNDVDNGLNNESEGDAPVADTQNNTPQASRPTRGGTIPATQQSSSSNEIQGMFIHVDERTNRIIVLGWPDQIDLFNELLALFDIPLPGGEIELEIIGLENTEAGDTLGKVKELINAINKQSSGKAQNSDTTGSSNINQRRTSNRQVIYNTPNTPNQSGSTSSTSDEEDSGPFMLADERLNRIFIIGIKEQITQARDLTNMIDQQWPGSKVRLEIFDFDVVEVEAITEQITQLIEALNAGENSKYGDNSVDKRRSQNNLGMGNQPINSNSTGSSNQNSSSFQQAGEEGPFLMADSRLNRLFVVGLDDQIEQVQELIKMLDKSIGLNLNIFPAFKYILSSEAADQVSKLMSVLHEQENTNSSGSSSSTRNTSTNRTSTNSRNNNDLTSSLSSSSRNNNDRNSQTTEGISAMISVSQRGPFLLPDDRTNRLLIVSTKEQYNEVLSLIPILDVPPSKYDEMTIEVYEPKFVTVSEVQAILDELGLTQSSASLDEKYRKRNNLNTNGNTNNNRLNNQNNNYDNYGNTNQALNQNRFNSDYTMIGNIEEPEIYVAIHENTNRLFIYAAKYQHEEIGKMVEKIDVEPDSNMGDYQVFSIKHRKPEDIASVLTQLLVDNEKPAGEAVQEEIQGKSIIVAVTDTPFIVARANQQKREQISMLIEELDKAMPQVLIEAQFVQISLDDSFKLGVSMNNNFETGSNASVSGSSALNLGTIETNSGGVAVGTGGTIAFFHDNVIKATLESLATKSNSEVTSTPRLLVNNNSEATFTSTKQKATTTTTLQPGSDTAITKFDQYVEAGTVLTITPQIGLSGKNADKNDTSFITLDVSIDVDSFDDEGGDGIPPGKSKNNIKTTVLIPDGATIILGGLTQTNWSDSVSKIPLLGDIPGIGVLFRNTTKSKSKTVLYLFIKATVAFDPDKDPDFESLRELSRINHEDMKKLKESFNEMPTIPGFNDNKRKPKVDEETETETE